MSKSRTTTKMLPVHPGVFLQEMFLEPLGISQYRLAKDIGVPPRRINEIVQGKRSISADTALRLARYLGTSADLWIGIQGRYDLDCAHDLFDEKIQKEVKPRAA